MILRHICLLFLEQRRAIVIIIIIFVMEELYPHHCSFKFREISQDLGQVQLLGEDREVQAFITLLVLVVLLSQKFCSGMELILI